MPSAMATESKPCPHVPEPRGSRNRLHLQYRPGPQASGSSCHFHSLASLITCSLLTFLFRTQGKCQHGNCSTCKARHRAISSTSSPSPFPQLVRPRWKLAVACPQGGDAGSHACRGAATDGWEGRGHWPLLHSDSQGSGRVGNNTRSNCCVNS